MTSRTQTITDFDGLQSPTTSRTHGLSPVGGDRVRVRVESIPNADSRANTNAAKPGKVADYVAGAPVEPTDLESWLHRLGQAGAALAAIKRGDRSGEARARALKALSGLAGMFRDVEEVR